MFDKFIKLNPYIFKGEVDDIDGQNWQQGVKLKVLSVGADPVQMQQLVMFTLEDYARKWWDTVWSDKKKMLATWAEFKALFYRQ